jgi:hypothetical protein
VIFASLIKALSSVFAVLLASANNPAVSCVFICSKLGVGDGAVSDAALFVEVVIEVAIGLLPVGWTMRMAGFTQLPFQSV